MRTNLKASQLFLITIALRVAIELMPYIVPTPTGFTVAMLLGVLSVVIFISGLASLIQDVRKQQAKLADYIFFAIALFGSFFPSITYLLGW